jgi:hypothetical protein
MLERPAAGDNFVLAYLPSRRPLQRHCAAEGPGRRLFPRGSPGAQPQQLGSPSLLWRSRAYMRSCPHSPLCGPALLRESRYRKGCGGLELFGDTTTTRNSPGTCVACDQVIPTQPARAYRPLCAPWFAGRSPWQDRYKSLDDSMSMRSPLQVAQPPSESPLHAFLTCASPAIGATVRGVRQPTLLRWILPWRRGLQRDGMACRGRTERPCGSSSRKGYRSPPTHGPARSTTGTSALGVTWASTSRRRTRKGCAQPAQRRDA